uniref:Uncharacterized protein n=1 Tax=Nicotiana tabacum TaxID=4097 RepID=A0A1S4D995_TOBAC|nr:uncharacterized protein LOC104093803 [Nicotiana tomentosiformis]XP_016509789.1 PREDICTED: uncharacterized protein LOC107827211 [Nicotiana tabacum]
MAKAYTIDEFNYQMAEIETIDKRVQEYLFDVGYDKWPGARTKVNRTTTMISNMVESINSAIKSTRDLPVTPLLDFMRNLVKEWNYNNKKLARETFIKLEQKYEDMLEENFIYARKMMVKR